MRDRLCSTLFATNENLRGVMNGEPTLSSKELDLFAHVFHATLCVTDKV